MVGMATCGMTAHSQTLPKSAATCSAARGDKAAKTAGDHPVAPLAVPCLNILASRCTSAPLILAPAGSAMAAARSVVRASRCPSFACESLYQRSAQAPVSFARISHGSPTTPSL